MFDAAMSFNLGEEVEALRDMVRRFAAEEIAPRAAQIDADNAFPADLWQKFGALGLLGITVSEEDGGSGMGYLAHCVALEEISRASASVGLSYAFQPLHQPAPPLGQCRAEGEVSAEAHLR